MQLQQVFWQTKLSPKQLIIDWDKFIFLFDEFILETISLKLNHVQKDYIKALIDPDNKNLVYKNSYLLFIQNFWQLPSNRTRLLKGQLNLSKVPRLKLSSDYKDQESVIIKIKYISDEEISNDKRVIKQKQNKSLKQKYFQLRKNILYTLDPKLNVISQKTVNIQSFLTFGRSEKNDVVIEDCSSINQEHFKLIKMIEKKPKQKKSFYMYDDNEQKNDELTNWYVRDVSKSNRLQYLLSNPSTYVVLRQGLSIKIGLTDQYELHVIKATPDDIQEHQIKELAALLNTDRINYLGEIDQSIPEKIIFDIPINEVKINDIQTWFNKGFNYDGKNDFVAIKKSINDMSSNDDQLPLIAKLIDKTTQQAKEYKLVDENIKVGRDKSCKIQIDKVSMRTFECQFVCITGVWMVKNIDQNCINISEKLTQSQRINQTAKKLKMKQLSVGLTIENSVENLQSSNRVKLSNNGSHQIKGKNFLINISFPKIKDKYR